MRSITVRCAAKVARCALLMLVAVPAAVQAQANLSVQGLGYAPGQLSTRALGTAGALGEIDPMSPLNPSALGSIQSTVLFFQMEPEYRSVDVDNVTDKTSVARYPLFFVGIPVGGRWVIGVSSSTLLDRTWSTSTTGVETIGADTVTSTFTSGSDGSINDLRVGGSWTPAAWIRAGVGIHFMSGSQRVSLGRTFARPAFASFGDTSVISFSGGAVSAGVELIAARRAIAAFSYRKGTNLRAIRRDTSLGTAQSPDRFGASLAFIGIAGTQIAARTSYNKWTTLEGLQRGESAPVDSWDTSIGADFTGPRIGSTVFMLRTGGRWRTLPYQAAGNDVRERSVAAGVGTLFGNGRVSGDVSVVRAYRDAGLTINERAWTLSIGLGVRP